MNRYAFRTLAGLSVAGALVGGAGLAQAQQQASDESFPPCRCTKRPAT